MATPTYTALATTTLSSAATDITISSIPSSYRDLVLIVDVPSSGNFIYIKPNGLATDLSQVRAYGDGSSGTSNTRTDWRDVSSGTAHRTHTYQFLDYSATDKHKTVLNRQNTSGSSVAMAAMRWASTSAITSIVVERETGDLPIGTTISLYGIEA